jgi:hypothetical protein
MLTRKLAAAVAVLVPFAVAAPAASAATTSASAPASTPPRVLTFIPPKVGPLRVVIGEIYIGGRRISPGVNVATQGITLPPIVWTLPS